MEKDNKRKREDETEKKQKKIKIIKNHSTDSGITTIENLVLYKTR